MGQDPFEIPEFRITGLDGISELVIEPMVWPEPRDHRRTIVLRVIHKTTGYYRLVTADLMEVVEWLTSRPSNFREIFDSFGRRGALQESVDHVEISAWKPGLDRGTRRFTVTLDPEASDRLWRFLALVRRDGWVAATAARTE